MSANDAEEITILICSRSLSYSVLGEPGKTVTATTLLVRRGLKLQIVLIALDNVIEIQTK